MSYVRLINQCGLYEDKIRIFKKNGACGLYTGALNRPKITVSMLMYKQAWTSKMYEHRTGAHAHKHANTHMSRG